MLDARSYSVTPRTICIRHEDGTRQVILTSTPKDADGVYGPIKGGSYKAPGGEWTRTWEHPQEWTDCG